MMPSGGLSAFIAFLQTIGYTQQMNEHFLVYSSYQTSSTTHEHLCPSRTAVRTCSRVLSGLFISSGPIPSPDLMKPETAPSCAEARPRLIATAKRPDVLNLTTDQKTARGRVLDRCACARLV